MDHQVKKTATPSGSMLYPLFFRLPPDNIVYLKYVLESYEGLGIVRTLDEQIAEIVILATVDTLPEVRRLVASLPQEIELIEISPPASLSGDWLLMEEQDALAEAVKAK